MESIEPASRYDTLLVVLGKNIGVDSSQADIRDDAWCLSTDTRLNVLAAGMVYQPGVKILLSGGFTLGNSYPSEPAASLAYLMSKFPDIPREDVMLDETSKDTAGSARVVAAILAAENNPYKHVGLLSVGYHVGNATKLFATYGARVGVTIASEEVVKNRSVHHDAYVTAWRGLKRVRREVRKERVRSLMLATIDPKGTILGHIINFTRK